MVNLMNLKKIYEIRDDEIVEGFLKNNKISIRNYEIECLLSLLDRLVEVGSGTASSLDGFSIGFSIPQIGKEFELLKITRNIVLNIELKSEAEINKIEKQQKRNHYYLESLDKEIYIFTYVKENQKIYFYNGVNCKEVSYEFLYDIIIQSSEEDYFGDIEAFFYPSQFLVSPFNNVEKFLSKEYFLTSHQEEIKKEIVGSNELLFSIQGGPGTGKTLLVYDIARSLDNSLIIHCGSLNEGQMILNKSGATIVSIKNIRQKLSTFGGLKFIVVDESQRLKKSQFETIINYSNIYNVKVLFSHDQEQCLHDNEINRFMSLNILEKCAIKHKLTDRIRTNIKISNFIVNLFDENNNLEVYKDCVDFIYLESYDEAILFKDYLEKDKGFKFLSLTPSMYHKEIIDEYPSSINAHMCIGQEFEKVCAIIDHNFGYNSHGKLTTRTPTYYHSPKMLYQILTRSREELFIIIVNNPNILKRVINIT